MVKIFPAAGRGAAIIDVLNSLKGPMAACADCLGCSVTVETNGGGAICYTERWRTREALDRHLRSALYCRVLEAMEFSCRAPEVTFYQVTETGGLEVVEMARACKDNQE